MKFMANGLLEVQDLNKGVCYPTVKGSLVTKQEFQNLEDDCLQFLALRKWEKVQSGWKVLPLLVEFTLSQDVVG
jgi:hypothetical protein